MMVTVFWRIKEYERIHRIQDGLDVPRGMTVNGESDIDITEEQLQRLRILERGNLIHIRPLKKREPSNRLLTDEEMKAIQARYGKKRK